MNIHKLKEVSEKMISDSVSLGDLCDVLNIISEFNTLDGEVALKEIDLSNLPTFGGLEPDDTSEIYSWDEDSILLFDDHWYLGNR